VIDDLFSGFFSRYSIKAGVNIKILIYNDINPINDFKKSFFLSEKIFITHHMWLIERFLNE